jgi:CRP-like cAMP-binding protein
MPAADTLRPLLRKLGLHHPLSEEDEAAILRLPQIPKLYEASQHIVREGDRPTHCCLVLRGFAIRHKVVGDGGRQIVNIHVPGDMVDLQNSLLALADHNVQALTQAQVAFIPREAIIDLAFERPSVGKALWLETLIEGSISREWITNVGRRNAQQRVAHLLCEFAYRLDAVGLGPSCSYQLPMTQEQIADSVGLTPVHVNRTLKALDAAGLTIRSKRAITIRDLPQLAEAGDFRSTYLHIPERALPEHHRLS